MPDNPYSRVYWSVMDDPKFDGIRENVEHLGAWTLLLLVADMAWPAPAFIPPPVPVASYRALVDAGLVDEMSGGRFRLHGLNSEREMRSQYGRIAAAKRWHSDSDADPLLAKTSKDKTSKDKYSPPPHEGKRANGTNPRAAGTNPRAQGTSVRQEREAQKRGPSSLHEILKRASEGA